jgi:hypothetical protein
MLWDAETKKAWDPKTYIPDVALGGKSWGRKTLADGEECFRRASEQRAWRTETSGLVLEEVYLSCKEQQALFFGRAEFLADDGAVLRAGSHQPLFHVEHTVAGTEARPLNLWRIVHLTSERDGALSHPGATEVLRKFIAIYVEKNLGVKMTDR